VSHMVPLIVKWGTAQSKMALEKLALLVLLATLGISLMLWLQVIKKLASNKKAFAERGWGHCVIIFSHILKST
jgi:hypothetical protein